MLPSRLAVTAGLVLTLAAAEPPPLPPAVAKELDAHAGRLAKIDQEAEKARTDERTRMAKVLDEAMKAETRKGNLDLAVRLRDLRDGVLQPKPAPAAKPTVSGDDLLGDDEAPKPGPAQVQVAPPGAPPAMPPAQLQASLQAMIGTWNMPRGTVWTIKPGGVFVRVREGGQEVPGTWRAAEGRIIFTYASGRELPLARVDARQLVVLREGEELVGERAGR